MAERRRPATAEFFFAPLISTWRAKLAPGEQNLSIYSTDSRGEFNMENSSEMNNSQAECHLVHTYSLLVIKTSLNKTVDRKV